MRKLSDLELTVLGIVWKKGPCTSYSITGEFVTSPSSHWSGSAGAIYPLARRLEERGYLASTKAKQGRRPMRLYTITRRGSAALRRWLSPPMPDAAAMITFDPIRTRAYFLASLSQSQRRAFVDEAEARLRKQKRVVEGEVKRYRELGDAFSALAMRGAVHAMRARLAWIAELRTHVEEEDDG